MKIYRQKNEFCDIYRRVAQGLYAHMRGQLFLFYINIHTYRYLFYVLRNHFSFLLFFLFIQVTDGRGPCHCLFRTCKIDNKHEKYAEREINQKFEQTLTSRRFY